MATSATRARLPGEGHPVLAGAYNYGRFEPSYYSFETFEGPGIGEPLPSLEVQTLDGGAVDLRALGTGPLVLESGSLTCPIYVGHIERMNALLERFPGVRFAVLYTREAHPGSRIGPHQSMEEKRTFARRLAEEEGEGRTILLDALDGPAHRALGSFPNLVYVSDDEGRVVYRAEWNDPDAVAEVLEHLVQGEHVPWVRPRPDHPSTHPIQAARVLSRAGPEAMYDLVRSIPQLVKDRRALEKRWDRRERLLAHTA